MSSNMEIYSNMNIEKGSFFGNNHKVIEFLRAGHFANVYKCLNTKTNMMEAVKISKTNPDSFSRGAKEITILKRRRLLNPDESNIVKYYGSFPHRFHLCHRFELLDQNLKDYMEETHKWGLPMPALRPVIQQLATALSHLSSVGIIHADIKTENVMMVDRLQTPMRVKLINFGMAHSASTADPDTLIQDILLKSPEALLGSPYDEAIDMWALGLMAAELATGYSLYPGGREYEMLKTITETKGQRSDKVLDCGRKIHDFINREFHSEPYWLVAQINMSGSEDDDESDGQLESLDGLHKLMFEDHKHQRDQHLLVDLIKRMLHLDQDKRIKPHEVLHHPFFTEVRAPNVVSILWSLIRRI